jgi:hypothetical protein
MFVARVELHGANWPTDYQYLHELLAKAGFYPTAVSVDNKVVKLPRGTYSTYQAYESSDAAFDSVKAAANATGYSNTLFVCAAGDWKADTNL